MLIEKSSIINVHLPVYLITSRERPKSALYLRLKNIQGTTIGKTWNFFPKKSHIAEKPKKKPFRLIKHFLQTENFKKFKGVPFDRIQKFSEKCRIVPKKPQRGTLWSPLYFWKHKKFVV